MCGTRNWTNAAAAFRQVAAGRTNQKSGRRRPRGTSPVSPSSAAAAASWKHWLPPRRRGLYAPWRAVRCSRGLRRSSECCPGHLTADESWPAFLYPAKTYPMADPVQCMTIRSARAARREVSKRSGIRRTTAYVVSFRAYAASRLRRKLAHSCRCAEPTSRRRSVSADADCPSRRYP